MAYDKGMLDRYNRALQNQSLSNVLPMFVSQYGLDSQMKFWSDINQSAKTDRFLSTGTPGGYRYMGRKSKTWAKFAESALEVLGGRPYAPGPTLETSTPGEARQAEAERISRKRRRGRGRIVLTGSLESVTRGKTLLG